MARPPAYVSRLRLGAACILVALLAAIQGNAQDAPVLKIVGADPQTGVKLTVATATVSLRLPLELDSGEVKGLTASVDDFIAPDASRIHPTVTLNGQPPDQPVDVTQKDRPVLEIVATFPIAGEYTSHLVLFYGGGRAPSVPLSVTRQRNEVTSQVVGLDTVTATKWLSADARIRFTVRETSGRKTTLYPPTLEGFALKQDDKVRKQARYGKVVVDCGKDARLTGTESFAVEPLSSRSCVVEVQEIAQAGEYSGTVRLASSNGTPVTQEVTVLVKTSGWVAAFWIFLGVLASFLIRRYTKEQRPRLQGLRRLRYAQEDLARVQSDAGAPAAPAPEVFAGLTQRLARIERDLTDRTATDGAAASLEEMEKKIQALPGWLTTGRKLDAVEPQDVVRAPRATWAALASSYFLKAGATDDITASLLAIDQEILAAVVARIDEFAAKVEEYGNSHPTAQPQIDQDVTPLLDRAKTEAKADDWTGMTTDFRQARLAYTRVLASGLEDVLEAPEPPLGLEDKDWTDLRNKITAELALIRQETDPDRAVEIYQRASRTYLETVAGKLKTLAAGLAQGATPEEEQQLDDAETALTAALLAMQKNDWDTARAEYQKAATAMTSLLDARKQAGGGAQAESAGQSAASPGETVPAGAAVGPVQALAAVAERRRSSAQQISDLLERYDLLLNVALLLIACVVGLSLLWLDDPVWGGWKAYTTALLWGLGLHQVAGSALDGLPVITQKLTE